MFPGARSTPAVLAAAFAACAGPPLARFEYAEPHMGTEFRVVLYAPYRSAAEDAAREAFERIAALDRAFSDYDPSSELERLGARSDEAAPTEPLAVSPELERVLVLSQELARASGGAFDVTVGPFVRQWRRARRLSEAPERAGLAEVASAVGYAKLELLGGGRVRLLAPHMRLDLGGIAKGFALDEARAVLAARGLERVLLVGGGDVLAGAPPPGRAAWRIELVGLDGTAGPRETVELARAAVSTSGDLERFLELDGVRYSHIVDPRTGEALTERRLASVVAPSSALADGLATALVVLEPRAGLELAASRPGVEARILAQRGARTDLFRSTGFPPPLSSVASTP